MEKREETGIKQRKAAMVAAAATGVIAVAGTIAFFSDRVSTETTAKAGTVDISLTESWADVENFNPGDKMDLDYTLSNVGNKSVDIRERIIVNSSVAMANSGQAEFEIYSSADVEQDANGAYHPKDGVNPIVNGSDREISADGKTITYNLSEYTLNGTGAGAETESGVSVTEKAADYVLIFKDAAANAFQDADVTVDYIAEAKQHRNTGADTWTTISTEQITVGSSQVDVVPGR